MTKKISFTITDEEHKKIKTHAEGEGLTPSQFAKRATIVALKSGYSSDRVPNDALYDAAITAPFMVLNQLGDLAEK